MPPIRTSRSALKVESDNSVLEREAIRHVAYQLYELRGRQDGHDLDDWLLAEDLVKQTRFRSTAA